MGDTGWQPSAAAGWLYDPGVGDRCVRLPSGDGTMTASSAGPAELWEHMRCWRASPCPRGVLWAFVREDSNRVGYSVGLENEGWREHSGPPSTHPKCLVKC